MTDFFGIINKITKDALKVSNGLKRRHTPYRYGLNFGKWWWNYGRRTTLNFQSDFDTYIV